MDKYIKDINYNLIHFTILLLICYVISCAIFVDLINTGINLDIHQFNLKTLSVIGMTIFGGGILGILKSIKE